MVSEPPVPEMRPEKIVLVLSLPVVSVAEPSVTLPALASEPTAWLKLFRSRVAPLATVNALSAARALTAPACSVPFVVIVGGGFFRWHYTEVRLPHHTGLRHFTRLRVRHVRFANVKVSCRYIDRGATETARAAIARLRRQRQAGVVHRVFPCRPGALAAVLDKVGLGALRQVVFPCGFEAGACLIEA